MDDDEVADLAAQVAGHLEPDDGARLVRQILDLGATRAEIEEAGREFRIGALALDFAVRGPGPFRTFGDAADEAGLTFEDAARVWRALGFPDPTSAEPQVGADIVAALTAIGGAREFLGEEAMFGLARVLGAATSRLAQAVVDSFRVHVETPQLDAGVPYSDVVSFYSALARDALPSFGAAVSTILSRHLLAMAAGTWSPDAESGTAQRDLVVGFADLVGFTALSRAISPGELAHVISRFEEAITEVVAGHGGRVVKLIGDGAMFINDDAVLGCRTALGIVDRLAGESRVPPIRVGLSAGGVVSLHGDLFGEVVNLAARLLAIAPASSVVAAESVKDRAGDAFDFEVLPPQTLKGFVAPATAYRVSRGA